MGFAPDSVGERTVSTLTIAFVNSDAVIPASNLAIVDNLPAGLRIATPSNASTDCVNGILSAPDGATTITLSNGRIGAKSSCVVVVDVTGDSPGDFVNVSGDVTSSAGNGGNASAQLSISANLPIFEMSFSPSSVPLGGASTITYSIENSLPTTPLQSVTFRNVLPQGMVVASPANVSTTCSGMFGPPLITAQPGTSEIVFFLSALDGGVSCAASVDVTASIAGALGNTTEPLMFSDPTARVSGKASAVLDVTVEQLNLSGFFSGDPVAPGESLFLDFTIANLNRDHAASAVAFINDLDATLGGLVALGLPMNDVCGAGSTISGTDSISLTGATLPAEGTSSPPKIFSSVDLPLPDGPNSTTNSPSNKSRSTPRKACTSTSPM